jgi:hypothetical protein
MQVAPHRDSLRKLHVRRLKTDQPAYYGSARCLYLIYRRSESRLQAKNR